MHERRALVGNAADEEQVKFAERKVKRRDRQRVELVRTQLATYEGRAFVWGELERHGVYDVVSGPIEAVYTFLGKREAGIELLHEIMAQHPDAYLLMQKEAIVRAQRERAEVDAARTPKGNGAAE